MSAIHTIQIDGEEKELVAYGDVFEYVENADLTHYVVTEPFQGEYVVFASKPYDDPDFGVVGETILLNDGHEYVPVNFGEDDDRMHAVDKAGLYNEIDCVYMWVAEKNEYVYFSGPYYDEETAQQKINELVGQ